LAYSGWFVFWLTLARQPGLLANQSKGGHAQYGVVISVSTTCTSSRHRPGTKSTLEVVAFGFALKHDHTFRRMYLDEASALWGLQPNPGRRAPDPAPARRAWKMAQLSAATGFVG